MHRTKTNTLMHSKEISLETITCKNLVLKKHYNALLHMNKYFYAIPHLSSPIKLVRSRVVLLHIMASSVPQTAHVGRFSAEY